MNIQYLKCIIYIRGIFPKRDLFICKNDDLDMAVMLAKNNDLLHNSGSIMVWGSHELLQNENFAAACRKANQKDELTKIYKKQEDLESKLAELQKAKQEIEAKQVMEAFKKSGKSLHELYGIPGRLKHLLHNGK